MDFLTRKITSAIDSLRDEVKALRESIDALRNQQERQHQQQQAQRSLPQPPIRVQAEIHEPPQEASEKRTRDDRNFRIQFAVAIGTIGATLATAYYAGVSRKTLVEIRKQTPKIAEAANDATEANKRAERTDRETRRAYIARPTGGSLSRFEDEDGVPVFGSEIFASGPTPAFNVRRAATFGVFKLPLSKKMPFCKDVPYTEEPFTMQDPEGDVIKTKVALSDRQKQLLSIPDYRLVVWGNVEYVTFEEIHHSRFCYLAKRDLKGNSTDKCPCQNNAD